MGAPEEGEGCVVVALRFCSQGFEVDVVGLAGVFGFRPRLPLAAGGDGREGAEGEYGKDEQW